MVRFAFARFAWRRVKLQKSVLQVFVNFHDGGLVTNSVAVVWCTEDGDDVFLMAPVVSIHNKLVGSGNQREPIVVVELLGDVLPKSVTSPTGGYAPPTAVVWV